MKKIILITILFATVNLFAQIYPIFGNEKAVTINGLTFDAMEPNLSTDGNALFFNSLNNGTNTSLYYASKVNDTTFNYIGLVPIVNQTVTPRLDAVATVDSANNFYWVTTRNYPSNIENLMRIKFLMSGYSNFGRLHGDFYINLPGYLIMDACTNYYGNQLIYCNAYFNSCPSGLPCKSSMGIAQKVNDSTFNKYANTSAIMTNINDTVNYIVYAPNITKDGLELYYTRLLKTGTQTEIMVSVRSNTNSAFSVPSLLIGAPFFAPEAPSLTADKSKLYYHKKIGSLYKLFVQYRNVTTSIISKNIINKDVFIYPNPANSVLNIRLVNNLLEKTSISIQTIIGEEVLVSEIINNNKSIDISALQTGIYFIKLISNNNEIFTQKLIVGL